jgi:hypothetical protein
MAEVVIRGDYVIGQRLHELHIDGHGYGLFADLEAVNMLLTRSLELDDFGLTGADRCGWPGDPCPLCGERPSCMMIASRTVVWNTRAEYAVWTACGTHASAALAAPAVHVPCLLLPAPVDRLGHEAVFSKDDDADMAALAAILEGWPVPADVFPGAVA